MMPGAKMLDPLLGIDFHLIVSAPGAPPVPIPHPSIGIIFDPMDLIPIVGTEIFISGLPRAVAGSAGLMLPHFPIGGLFVKPPANEQEVFMGSKTVSADDEALSYFGLPVLCCQCIGLPPIPRKKGKKKKKVPRGMVLPTGLVLAIPTGVFVGGPPTISLTALGFRAGMAAAGKLLGAGFRRMRKAQRNSPRWRGLSRRAHRRADALASTLRLGPAARNRVHRAVCTVTGHPVDVATGKVFTDFTDLELPGPLPFVFERVWYSTSTYPGPFGHGWHHNYDTALYVTPELVLHRTPDGRAVPYPPLAEGEFYFNREERCTLTRDVRGYRLETSEGLNYHFGPVQTRPTSDAALGAPESRIPASSMVPGSIDSSTLVLNEVSNRAGHRIRLAYDRMGQLRELVDSAGRLVRLELDAMNRIVALSVPHPDIANQRFDVARYTYDELGNLTSMTDALGHVFQYQYEGHLLVRETDRSGLNFYFQWDGRDENASCVRTWGDGSLYDRQIAYGPGITTVTDSLGCITVYEHRGGLVTRTTDARGAVHSAQYEHGQVIWERDALGRTTEYEYDERGNPKALVRPDGVRLEYKYDERDLPLHMVDPLGGRWTWQHDDQGQLTTRTDPLGATTQISYARGLAVAVTDALGQRTNLEYDAQGNPTLVLGPDGSGTRFRYNQLGWPVEILDARGNVQRNAFDLRGKLRRVEEADGNVRDFEYDGEGRTEHVADRHHEILMTYSGMGRLATRTQAGTTVRFEYDTEEQLRTITNEHGVVYGFERGPLGEVTLEHGFDGVRRAYEYDPLGRVQRIERANGLQTHFDYDVLDRVVAVRHSDGTREAFAYGRDGMLARAEKGSTRVVFERDALGRVLREHQGDFWVQSEYDALGRRIRVASSLGLDQHVERNAAGDVIRIRATTSKDRHEASAQAAQRGAPRADEFEVSFTRDALGLELDRSLGGGVRSRWLRDKLGRPLQHEILIGTQRHRGVGYNWDVGGRLSRIIDALSGPVAFSHDMLGQLAGTTHADGRVELRLPDAVGNLFKRSDRADRRYGPAGQLLESIDVRGRITRYGYDAEGNLIEKRLQGGAVWRYAWGADGYLREVTRPDGTRVVFQYDALGRRVLKSYRGQHTRWIWDGDVPVHEWVEGELEPAIVGSNAEPRDSDDARVNRREAELSRHLVRGPPERGSRDQPITWLFEPDTFAPLARLQAGLRQNIVTDQLGSPIAMLNEQGEVTWSGELDTWGELRMSLGEAHACPFRYPGQYADPETGLHYNRFRYYDPESGQYASQDPIGLEGGLALHAYAPDPLVSADPLGLSTYGLTPGTGAPYRRLVPGTPGRVRGGSSTQLGRNMFHAMGMARNTRRAGYQAQHVIPSELRNHPVLRALGMDLDDASNGIFLPVPRGDVSPLSRHRGYHSVYNDFVRTRLDLINPADPLPSLDQQVAAVRDRLRYLQRQGLPLYPSQGASIALWTRMYR